MTFSQEGFFGDFVRIVVVFRDFCGTLLWKSLPPVCKVDPCGFFRFFCCCIDY